MKTIIDRATELSQRIIDIRRELHRYPEISFKEYRTTEFITKLLVQAGIEIVPWGGDTGVVGLLKGTKPGPVVALRADIDALPVEEENECSYRSLHPGVMHACGHDSHTASLLGAALILAELRESLAGTVKFIFQPAEEINAGAKAMIEQGVLSNPAVDVIFGLHNTPSIPAGQVGCKEGPLMAAVDTTFLTIKGIGGHGAIPHKTRDPIMAAAAVIQGLQTIVSRQVDPLSSAVISFGTIQGGHANNVIPEKVELTGTVRTFDPALRAEMPDKMCKVINGIAQAMDTEADFVYRKDLPAVFNPPELTKWCREVLEQVFGDGVIVPTPGMGGEDFAIFQEKVPGVFLWLGVGNTAKGIVHQWHNPRFDIDEEALKYGAAALAQLAHTYLENKKI
ncbi:M20 family metallopeptidase [Sporomusa sp. GT1]|uniref:M20 metallopeptidase family protein n=1 Tax=Sporomusa sp. GT1 TaxID=1534747 RepID=UPI0016675038|nr:M20 family metallopeptidase [Sporomusa sp. GT1]